MFNPKKIFQNKNIEDPFRISAKDYSELEECEKDHWVPVKGKHERISIICYITFGIAALCAIIYLICLINTDFADFINLYVGTAARFTLAKVSSLVPFSVAELVIILLPVITFLAIWYLLKYRCKTRRDSFVSIVCILSVLSIFLSTFVLCLGTGYKCSTLDKRLKLKAEAVSVDELYASTEYLTEKINELSPLIRFGEDGFSNMPYSFSEMNQKLIEAYDNFEEDHDFIINFKSRLKPVMISEAMSYAHIGGIYSFFTGESNINVSLPDYTIPYTAAHELAHQRGIAREDEANMIAFLVCIRSDDPYIQYSAYVNMYEYVAEALRRASSEKYKQLLQKLDLAVYNEQLAYSEFFKKYQKSVTSKVSGTVNDVYLKTQGTAGRKSYGMVVDLTVAYFKSENIISTP